MKQIGPNHAGKFVHKSKISKNPKLTTLFNHEKSKRFDFQSRIQTSMQWIFAQAFDLIQLPYIQAS